MGFARFFLCLNILEECFKEANKERIRSAPMSELIVEKITDFAESLLPSLDVDLELVEVQFRREQHGWVLRLYIDAQDGVSHEHCRMVSRELGDFLDVENLIDHAYHLEISSPGLERKLMKIDDFQRFLGRKAKIKMIQPIDGQKVFVGEIVQVNQQVVDLLIDGSKTVSMSYQEISSARLAI